jgi:hypothetical protein
MLLTGSGGVVAPQAPAPPPPAAEPRSDAAPRRSTEDASTFASSASIPSPQPIDPAAAAATYAHSLWPPSALRQSSMSRSERTLVL